MEPPDIRGQWNANAAAWTEMSRAGFDRYRDLVNTPGFFALLPPVDGLTCLDLGCGEGHNTRLLAGRGARVVGLDIAESFIADAAGVPHQSTRYLLGDGALLPFRAASFGAVTAFMSLMDVADPERALREVARVLRPAHRDLDLRRGAGPVPGPVRAVHHHLRAPDLHRVAGCRAWCRAARRGGRRTMRRRADRSRSP